MVRDDEPTRLVAETKLQLARTPWRSSRKIPCLVRFACGRFYAANYSFQSERHAGPAVRAVPSPTVAVRTQLFSEYPAVLLLVFPLPPRAAGASTGNHS